MDGDQDHEPRLKRTAALDFTKAALRLGRNDGPALLVDWWADGRLTRRDLRAVITEVWQMAEWPERRLGTSTWVDLFRTAGFVDDEDEDAEPPTELLCVCRGSTWGHRRGMAWTRNVEQAKWFADRWTAWGKGEGLVFEVTVPPETVLALIGMGGGRDEAEVVVDPALLPPIGRRGIRGV